MTGPRGNQLLIELPAGVTALRLDAAAEPFDTQARMLLDQLTRSGRRVDSGERAVRAVTTVLDLFAALNVQLVGKFAVATTDGPAVATVVIAVHPLPIEDRDSAAADLSGLAGAIHEIIRRRHPRAETKVVPLPSGPAVAGVWLGELRLPRERTGIEEDMVLPTHRVQFLIPLPTAEHLVALDVSTVSEQAWPTVARQAVSIAGSVRIDDVH
ncbi:MAG: hypothetical protein ACRDTJ_28415 [Pseudonocardiaceae bacterium]